MHRHHAFANEITNINTNKWSTNSRAHTTHYLPVIRANIRANCEANCLTDASANLHTNAYPDRSTNKQALHAHQPSLRYRSMWHLL
jgi:hypothetical protein